MQKILCLALVTAALFLGNGCALFLVGGAAAAGAGAVYYIDGELKDTETASFDAVHTAALAAVRDLQFAVVSDAKDAINSKILVRTATDKKITITLAKQSPTVTEIRIRVGTFGDEQMSRQILDGIKAHL